VHNATANARAPESKVSLFMSLSPRVVAVVRCDPARVDGANGDRIDAYRLAQLLPGSLELSMKFI
jgi:hypothetical protein